MDDRKQDGGLCRAGRHVPSYCCQDVVAYRVKKVIEYFLVPSALGSRDREAKEVSVFVLEEELAGDCDVVEATTLSSPLVLSHTRHLLLF